MNPRFVQACESFQPAEKACWEILFRELPAAERFPAAPLDLAMDRALTQLWQVLRADSPEQRLAAAAVALPVLPIGGECPLRAHLPYYDCGVRALELIASEVAHTHPEALGPDAGAEREELAGAFDLLVQCQLESLCGGCQRAGICQYSDRRPLKSATASAETTPRRQRPCRRTRKAVRTSGAARRQP